MCSLSAIQRSFVPAVIATFFILAPIQMARGQEIDGEAKGHLAKIKYLVDQGGDLFKKKDFGKSAAKIRAAQSALVELADDGNKSVIDELANDYERIENAQKLLKAKGEEFEEMPALSSFLTKSRQEPNPSDKEAPDPMQSPAMASDDPEMVSFTKQVAPIILQNCGQCHVSQSRGKYSAATYTSLVKGTKKGKAVVPGDIEMSRMIVLIEEGSMPPKANLQDEQLLVLKTWVEQGAKFDGEKNQRNANLTTYVSDDGGDANGTAGATGGFDDPSRSQRGRPPKGTPGVDRDR